ncbi:MAG: leucyl aminopeptidase [Candidatus Gottesmanbacteria bacterium]|nr:leucyl aminopeptidase [Candidatus Gottesmanbacteria bacterium]
MKFFTKPTDVTKIECDLVTVFASQEKGNEGFVLSDDAKKIDAALGGMLTEIATFQDFEATPGNTILIHTHGKIGAMRTMLVGLGNVEDLAVADLHAVAATIGRKSVGMAVKSLAVSLSHEFISSLGHTHAGQTMVEGLTLGTYTFSKHKSLDAQRKEKHIEDVFLLTTPPKLDAVAVGISKGEAVSQAVVFTRDLVNEPPSTTTPTYLADVAKKLVKENDLMSCDVLTPKEMKTIGMEALLSIARGSDEEPRFIKLTYKGGGKKTICLVGKGITFDTGGLSLKDAKNMETMKLDMAGAAVLLGIFSVLPLLKPKLTVVGLISATENMPGPKAVKPGDIVRAMNGKTIEILNTDAEGRVVLADALSYAGAKVKADAIIDLATLTGACMVALGEDIAGMFTDDEALGAKLKDAAIKSGEHIWGLPLVKEYKEQLKSEIADVKNISSTRYGGAINGALFLQEFAPKGVPWAHLDIAGPAYAEKDAPLTPKGGTGFGVRMILRYLLELAS